MLEGVGSARPRPAATWPLCSPSHKSPRRDDADDRERGERRQCDGRRLEFLDWLCVGSSGRRFGEAYDELREAGTVVAGTWSARRDRKSATISREGECGRGNAIGLTFDSLDAIDRGGERSTIGQGSLDHCIGERLAVGLMRTRHSQEDDE